MVMLVKLFPFCWGQLSVLHVENGEIVKKMNAKEDLKCSCHRYLSGGLLCFLLKKYFLCKIKYASEVSK